MAEGNGSGGWRDPRVRALRTATVALMLALLAWLTVFDAGARDVQTIGMLLGATLVMLGVQVRR